MERPLILDCETRGLRPELGETAFAVALSDPFLKDLRIYRLEQRADVEEFLERVAWADGLIGHNVLFDLRQMVVSLSLPMNFFDRFSVWDTLLMAKHVWPGRWSYGLKQLTTGMDDALKHEDPKKWLRQRKLPRDYSLLPDDILIPYLTNDIIRTAALWRTLEPQMPLCRGKAQLDLDLSLLRPVLQMQLRGVRIDSKRLDDLVQSYESMLKEAQARLPFSFLKRSALVNQFGPALASLGFTTATGQPRCDREALNTLAARGVPLAAELIKARLLHKVLGTYLRPWNRWAAIGRLHGSFHIFGASTGRASASQPNLQNIPSEMRTVLTPDSGCVFVVADYSQQEVRSAAYLSGDEGLLEALAGGDVHRMTAQRIFGVETPTDLQRKIAKTILFASLYGARAKKIRASLSKLTGHPWKLEECQKIVDGFWRAYPRLETYVELCNKHAKRGIPMVDPLGRPQYPDKMRPWALFNAVSQGFSAGVTKLAMKSCSEMGLDMRLVVHDEIVIQCEKSRARQVAEELRALMTKAAPGFVFPVEVSIAAESWGSKIKLEEWNG